MLVSSSPERFVGNYVLLRLCVPRYPPLALCSLTFLGDFSPSLFLSLSSMQFSRFWLDFAQHSFLSYLSIRSIRLGQVLDFFILFGLSRFRWAILDLNQGPHGYQPCALTT
jgi:hypothetical protein